MINHMLEWRRALPPEPPLETFREFYDCGEVLPWGRDKRGRCVRVCTYVHIYMHKHTYANKARYVFGIYAYIKIMLWLSGGPPWRRDKRQGVYVYVHMYIYTCTYTYICKQRKFFFGIFAYIKRFFWFSGGPLWRKDKRQGLCVYVHVHNACTYAYIYRVFSCTHACIYTYIYKQCLAHMPV